jgi:hypothetical protein
VKVGAFSFLVFSLSRHRAKLRKVIGGSFGEGRLCSP